MANQPAFLDMHHKLMGDALAVSKQAELNMTLTKKVESTASSKMGKQCCPLKAAMTCS